LLTIKLLLTAVSLSACSSPVRQAPIEDRAVIGRVTTTNVLMNTGATGAPVLSSGPTMGGTVVPQTDRPGFHTVKAGETLYSIALAYGQDFRQVAAWNQLADAGVIKVGQVLRVKAADETVLMPQVAPTVQTAPVKAPENIDSRPLASSPLPSPSSIAPSATTAVVATVAAKPSEAAAAGIDWAWPVGGAIIERFDESRNKGIDIAGKTGDPVLASADGKVVYVGNGLRGYGNLVIVKHNDDFISAYAHNNKLLVQLHELVKRGQKIAEMGSSDADRPKLHFEIRREGKPDDPLKYLPERK
jgi:lipoprotein NlpD